MTLMVRDEVDIIAPMIEYHLSAGVDVLIITDNGSIDGTREVLAEYEEDTRIVVIDHPDHDKNQSARVTEMARRAYSEFSADWVINADADEFFVPVDRSLDLRTLFSRMPSSLGSVVVPVIDMTGAPARSGAGLARLTLRDERPEDDLYWQAGLHAHATPDAVHVGAPDVTVSQGNHFVSIPSRGELPPGLELESLHFPWRSYDQFSKKVINAGRAYDSNPGLTPSPRHHGMRDYRFFRAGVLEEIYLYRHPRSERPGQRLRCDDWLMSALTELANRPSTRRPDLIRAALVSTEDHVYHAAEREAATAVARAVLLIEEERSRAAAEAQDARNEVALTQGRASELEDRLTAAQHEIGRLRLEAAEAVADAEVARRALESVRASRTFRAVRLAAAPLDWFRRHTNRAGVG
ncbi:glycosyltransferase family 2 protein [Microbacterium sp. SMR1]|uniref:glycosyltransferase family 2 protein n=1 Tax=Microbacterium sp. SMR1 TaxID=1497340 RepID=UPI000DCB6F3C|nr:glycosyltransferase family 2 protein [Microbacterium sp. SMR1]RAZ31628.1 glycosyltransferase family 2 protein [Microbacterium sp. SMR1]